MMKAVLVAAVLAGAATVSGCSSPMDPVPHTTSPVPTASTHAVVGGDAILIETHITDARAHTGAVLDGSVLGESAFCPGGVSAGSSQGPTITTTFTCPEGTLTVRYAPTQFSLAQSAAWEIVSGTGEFGALVGGGSMVAVFEADDPDAGREIFTGTVGS
jgi:hypothetical protein